MMIIGCDFHTRYQQIAMMNDATGEPTSTVGSTAYPAWGLSWTYDRYGNRTAQNNTGGSVPSDSLTISKTTNQITGSGYSYDAAGNMTGDALNTMTYDAASRLISSSNGTTSGAYAYDGKGMRVRKCVPNCSSPTTTTVYIYAGGKVLAEYDNGAAVGSPSRENIYSGSTQIAKIASGTTTYYHQDHLSNRLVTSSSGTVVEQMGHLPYGENWYDTGGDKWRFTSYERDAESGNDYAMARYNSNRFGRFTSPDPLSGSTANPQSLNHYSYAGNDPINAADPTGLSEALEVCGAGPAKNFWDQTCGAENWVLNGGQTGNGSGAIDFGDDAQSRPYEEEEQAADPDNADPIQDPCKPMATLAVPRDVQQAQTATFGLAITEVQFGASGDAIGFSIVIGAQDINTSGVTFAAGSSIHAQYNGSGDYLSLYALHGNISLSEPTSAWGASISSLTFANGAINTFSGSGTLWGVQVPFTTGSAMDKLNQNPSVISALSGLESALAKCAGSQ